MIDTMKSASSQSGLAYTQIRAAVLGGVFPLGTVLTDYDTSLDRKRQYYYDYGNPGRV